ncbi:Fatty acid metabolism regulator protein [subsurface metagenome]
MKKLSRKERERLARKREILEAAQRVFAQKGFHQATIDEIAKEAELAKGTIYLYFKNKRELFYSLVEEKTEYLMNLIRKEAKKKEGPVEKLSAITRHQLGFYEANRDFFKIITSESSRFELGLKDELRKRIMDRYLKYIDVVARVIEEGIKEGRFKALDAKKVAATLRGIIDALAFQWMLSKEKESLVSNAPLIMELFLSGAKKQGS